MRELNEIEPRLAAHVSAQKTRRTQDTVGAILIGLTPTMFSPNNEREYEIARLKGERDALRAEGQSKGCRLPAAAPAAAAKTSPPPERRVNFAAGKS